MINLKEYSNNNKEHFLNLQSYMKSKLKGIVVKNTTDLDKEWNEVKFEMTFENSLATGQFTYNPPKGDNKLGNYNLKIYKDNAL